MIKTFYKTLYHDSYEIKQEDVTGKYKIMNNTMYIQVRVKCNFINRLIMGKYYYRYIMEDNISFVEIQYFDCKKQ